MSVQKVACCYWEGIRPPAYLAWCVSSWLPYLNLDDVLFLNQSNVHRYLGDLVDVRQLRRYSFAKQSDIVSAAYLYKFGGIFLDIDSIFVNSGASKFFGLGESRQDGVFRYFGNAAKGGVHIGVISSPARGVIVEGWQNALFQRVPRWRDDKSWSYVGNEIVQPLIHSEMNRGVSQVIDVDQSLSTPESVFATPGLDTARERYEDYWFSRAADGESSISTVIQDSAGIVCLHNSWTPAWYERLTTADLEDDSSRLSELLGLVGNLERVEEIRERVYLGD